MADRVDTQFVGSPAQVDQLDILREATGADELLVTTTTPTGCGPTSCWPGNGNTEAGGAEAYPAGDRNSATDSSPHKVPPGVANSSTARSAPGAG